MKSATMVVRRFSAHNAEATLATRGRVNLFKQHENAAIIIILAP